MPGATSTFLPPWFAATTANFTAIFSMGNGHAAVSLLSQHRLLNQSFVYRHGKNRITEFQLTNRSPVHIVQFNLWHNYEVVVSCFSSAVLSAVSFLFSFSTGATGSFLSSVTATGSSLLAVWLVERVTN